MGDFVVLGCWQLDSRANFQRITLDDRRSSPKDLCPDIPAVLKPEEFWTFVKGKVRSISVSLGDSLPSAKARCPECGGGFDLENRDKYVREDDPSSLHSLTRYTGKTMQEAAQATRKRRDGIYRLNMEIVRNDRNVDLDTSAPGSRRLGWVDVTPEYVIREGDEGSFTHFKYYHPGCHTGRKAHRQWNEFRRLFTAAGYGAFALKSLPNQYHGDQCKCCAPWYDAYTQIGLIRLGWRKRVIEIDWSGTGTDLVTMFAKEEVTKTPRMIHAWGIEDAARYLRMSLEALYAPVPA